MSNVIRFPNQTTAMTVETPTPDQIRAMPKAWRLQFMKERLAERRRQRQDVS